MRTEQRKPAPWLGVLFALGATVIWSGNFVVARELYETVSPAMLAFLRWITATLALAPVAALAMWRERRIIRRHMKYLLATSFTGVTVFNTLLYLAARSTSALNLSLIAITAPVFTLLFARFLIGEPFTLGRAAGVALAAAGVAVLVTRGEFALLLSLHFSMGDLWMAVAAVIFGLYTVLVRMRPRQLGQTSFLLATFVAGTIMLVPWTAWEARQYGIPEFNPALLGSVLYIGLGASLASYVLWTRAVEIIGPSRSGFIYYSLPLFSGLEAFFLLGEPVGIIHAVSGLLILGGIVLATRG